MAEINLKYLTELPAASSAQDEDLLHLSQAGIDKSVTVGTIVQSLVQLVLPVGSVIFRATTENPNFSYPGTTWVKLPAGCNIRTMSEDGKNILSTDGSDSVRLTAGNLPSHTHDYSGTTGQSGNHTHGTGVSASGDHTHAAAMDAQGYHGHNAWTDAQGQHQHLFHVRGANNDGTAMPKGNNGGGGDGGVWTDPAGNHSHNVGIDGSGQHTHNVWTGNAGNHSHSVTVYDAGNHTHNYSGTTKSAGSGETFTILPKCIYLAGWRRTA